MADTMIRQSPRYLFQFRKQSKVASWYFSMKQQQQQQHQQQQQQQQQQKQKQKQQQQQQQHQQQQQKPQQQYQPLPHPNFSTLQAIADDKKEFLTSKEFKLTETMLRQSALVTLQVGSKSDQDPSSWPIVCPTSTTTNSQALATVCKQEETIAQIWPNKSLLLYFANTHPQPYNPTADVFILAANLTTFNDQPNFYALNLTLDDDDHEKEPASRSEDEPTTPVTVAFRDSTLAKNTATSRCSFSVSGQSWQHFYLQLKCDGDDSPYVLTTTTTVDGQTVLGAVKSADAEKGAVFKLKD